MSVPITVFVSLKQADSDFEYKNVLTEHIEWLKQILRDHGEILIAGMISFTLPKFRGICYK